MSSNEIADPQSGHGLDRGAFLTKATLGVGGVMGALIVVPVAGMALAPAFEGQHFEPIDLGPTSQFDTGTDSSGQGTKYVKAVLHPDPTAPDAYVQQRVAYIRKNADNFVSPLTKKKEQYTVISNRCAHLGCPVQNSGQSFNCPCHGGAYDGQGKRIAGPPVRPLDRYSYVIKNGHMFVTGEYSLRQDGTRIKHRGPGQHTNGVEGILYPLQP